MNWYKGNIAEAVAQSKTKNAIFVVYVEGKDETTQKLTGFINEPNIRVKLESDDFVAIKIESDSQAYMQFATIYQVVPVPSIFFIGKSGTPLDIGTGIIETAAELEQKIDKVLAASGKTTPSSLSASSSFISTEQADSMLTIVSPEAVVGTTSASTMNDGASSNAALEDDNLYGETTEPTTAVEAKSEEQPVAACVSEVQQTVPSPDAVDVNARLEETRKQLEEKRRERVEAENKLEQERELRRRREAKDVQNLEQWQKEQELKELKENRRRDRLEEQAVRERIRAQIAGDRAERAQRFPEPVAGPTTTAQAASASAKVNTSQNADTTRLQFRFSSGKTAMQVFNCQDTLQMVRIYVETELLPGTGIKDFTLATTYPKREFDATQDAQTLAQLELLPSAVILVIGRESSTSPGAIIARSGGLLNMLTSVFWAMLSPVFAVLGYVKSFASGRRADRDNAGANKRANDALGEQQEAAKRRNLDRFSGGGNASGSSSNNGDGGPGNNSGQSASPDAGDNGESKPYRRYGANSNIHRLTDNRKDSDDENATWNGNSTQQQ